MRLPLLLAAVALLAPSGTEAMFVPPQYVPVERLVQNAEKYVAAHPKDPEAHYTLGRVHYLAFSSKRAEIYSYAEKPEGPVNLPSRSITRMFGNGKPRDPKAPLPAELPPAEVLAHAKAAVKHFNDALTLAPDSALYHLGLASLLEEVRTWLATTTPADVPQELANLKMAAVRAEYARAFDLALPKDRELKSMPISGVDSIISYEAANALERLATEDPASLTDADRQRLAANTEALAQFKALPRMAVTPIVFSPQPAAHLAEMLAPEVTVDFDVRGYGPAQRWPWVKPELGFLVWDPFAEGRITSGRQLFGGYTFQIFRATGYAALAALDDNGDGKLSGSELKGLRVWFDRNSDGVSTAEEVVSLESLGITGIACQATAQDGPHPMNPAGLELRGGRTLPTWDWMVLPALPVSTFTPALRP